MKFLIFVLVNIFLQQGNSLNVTSIEGAINLIKTILEHSGKTGSIRDRVIDVVYHFDPMAKEVWKLHRTSERKEDDTLSFLQHKLPAMSEDDKELITVSYSIIGIILSIDPFKQFVENNYLLRRQYKRLHETVSVNYSMNSRNMLKNSRNVLLPYGNSSLRESLVRITNALNTEEIYAGYFCNNGEPPQVKLYDFYNFLIGAELSGYLITSTSYRVLEIVGKTDYSENSTRVELEMRKRINDYAMAFSEADKRALPMIRRCDGWHRQAGVTYEEFKGFRTKYMINLIYLDLLSLLENTCNQTCETVDSPTNLSYCVGLEECRENYCDGRIDNCVTWKGGDLEYCESSRKRYVMVKDSNNEVFGKYTRNCNWKTLSSRETCHICICDCFEDIPELTTVRSISFREQIADIKNNKVVTGVRLLVKNLMVHIQIQQGDLSFQGYADLGRKGKGAEWLPLESIRYNEHLTFTKSRLMFDIVTRNGEERTITEKEDFGAFKIGQDRINLDYLVAPKNYIITGVRFNYPRRDAEDAPIQLEIHVTPFDFFLGKLIIDDDHPSKWLTPDDMRGVLPEYHREREELILSDHLDDPRLLGPTKPVSEPNSYIRIQTTSFKEDIGQTVLPLIDILEVVGDPSFGLGRISLLYKASELRGSGFISLAIGMVNPLEYLRLDDPS